jgi:hypothetical protein
MSTQAFAPSQHEGPRGAVPSGVQLTDEHLQTLQEIHDLINLLLKEIPTTTQATTRSFAIPSAPYMYPLFQIPWGRLPFGGPFGL